MSKVHYTTVDSPPPMKHQQDCFYKLYQLPYGGIFGEQGTGKTRMSIDLVSNHFVEGHIDAVLMIAPKGVHEQWYTEQIPEHSPVPTLRFLWETKNTKRYKIDLEKFLKAKPVGKLKWFCVNVDTFSTDNNIFIMRDFLKSHKAAIIVDESTRIKNPAANRTYNIMYNLAAIKKQGRAIKELYPYSIHRYILTGMQVTNSPYDLWSPFNFLSFDFFDMNYYAFRAKYGIEVQDTNKQSGKRFPRKILPREIESILSYYKQDYSAEQIGNILGISCANVDYICQHPQIKFPYKHLDELKAKIEPYSFTIRKEDCLDLPPKVYQKVFVEMTAEQRRVYKDLEKKMIAEYDGKELTVTNKLALVTRLQQITSGFFPYTTKEFDLDNNDWELKKEALPIGKKNPKINDIKAQIDETGGERIFIACKYVAEIELLRKELEKTYPEKVIRAYYGALADKERDSIVNAFKAGEIDILIMNIRMAIGFNFQEVCHNGHAFSGTYSLEDRKQWEDRLHRIGQKLSVNYVDYICRGTIDEKIYAAIKTKENLLNYFRDHSLTEFLVGEDL